MVDRTLIRSELECPAAYVAVAVILGTACACVPALPWGPAEDAAPLAATWSEIRNPFLDLRPRWTRDPLLVREGGRFRCYYTAGESEAETHRLAVDVVESADLLRWSAPYRIADSPLSFSSPGSLLQRGDRWLLAVQSYPIKPGQSFGSGDARLWVLESRDLSRWSAPRMLRPEGCRARWAAERRAAHPASEPVPVWLDPHRQIDPFLMEHAGRYWCFYKTAGCLGLMVSDDLRHWEEASLDRPVLGPADTPDGASVENPCVVRDGAEYVMFFSPTRAGRGIGVARSTDLLHWHGVHYLDFPELPWAPGGPTAAMVLDARRSSGKWIMVFHGERPPGPHSAALGLAWSEDLERWTVAPPRPSQVGDRAPERLAVP